MPYRFLEDLATADVAFEAWGKTVEEMFLAAAEATMNVMVGNPDAIAPVRPIAVSLQDDALDMLLFQFLQELIFYKDADMLLLRVRSVRIAADKGGFTLSAEARGEEIDRQKHELSVDVKAVTLYRLGVVETEGGWKATVVLDI